MQKIKLFILTLGFFILNITTVSAACDFNETNELNNLATNVKVSYELKEGTYEEGEYTPPDGLTEEEEATYVATYYYFEINITNLTEDLYITVYDDLSEETKKYTYEDSKNGDITINHEDIKGIVNYTVTVYSSNNTNCPDSKLFTNYLSTPAYNEYSEYTICDGKEDFYLCHQFVTFEVENFGNAIELIELYEKGKINDDGEEVEVENEKENSFMDFIKEYKGIVIGVTLGIIAIGGLVIVIIVKKRRSEKA